MSDIKLRKLPDRTPVKMTISLSPDLKQELDDYAAIYKATYGEGGKHHGANSIHALQFYCSGPVISTRTNSNVGGRIQIR